MIRKILIITSIIISASIFANDNIYQRNQIDNIKEDFTNINLTNHQNLINNSDINLDRKDIQESYKSLEKEEIHKIDNKRIDPIKEKFSDINLSQDLIKKAENMNKNLFPKLSKKYQSKEKNHNGLVIFLSASLSPNLWSEYQQEIIKYNARPVIKGFIDESMKKTINFINKIENRKAGVEIDPNLFKKFNITKVPTIILYDIDQCQNDECTPNFDKITGTVSIKYFLERVEEEGDLSKRSKEILSKSHYR
jgi:type-F conjugative transfer system pilin assembly protein TrbC